MAWSEIIFGTILVLVLLGLGAFFGTEQFRHLRSLSHLQLPDEELRYERNKTRRRLFSSALLMLIGVLLASSLIFHEPTAQQIADQREAFTAEDAPPFTEEQRAFLRIWGGTWIVLLLTLMAVVLLAAVDLWATRRHGLRLYRKLREDRRAMVRRQVERLRREREEDE